MGELARKAREKRGYENQYVARRVSISASCLTRYENGEREIPCQIVPAMSRCLGCPEMLEKRLLECPVMAAMREERRVAA